MSIRVVCPSCGKGIKAPEKYAGKSAKCPGCGGQISIPNQVDLKAVAVPPQIPNTSTPCPFCAEPILQKATKCKHCGEFLDDSRRQDNPAVTVQHTVSTGHGPKEQNLLKVRPKVFRNNLIGIFFLWLFLFIALIIAITGSTPEFWGLPALFLLMLILKYLAAFTTSLTVTTTRSILRLGILSKRTREVRHCDVRLLQVDQSFFQRIMGVGGISLASAGHGEIEIVVSGLRNPNHIKETIDGYRG